MKKSKIMFALFFCILMCANVSSGVAQEPVKVILNGKPVQFEVAPQIIDNRVLVPIRFVADNLGGTAVWDQKSMSVVVTKNDHTMTMWPDRQTMLLDGKSIALDVAPQAIAGRVFIPLRTISTVFDVDVEWQQASNMVFIKDKITLHAPSSTKLVPDGNEFFINKKESNSSEYWREPTNDDNLPKEKESIISGDIFTFSGLDNYIKSDTEINFSIKTNTNRFDGEAGYKLSLESYNNITMEDLVLQYKEDGTWKKAVPNAKGEFTFPSTLPTEFKANFSSLGYWRFIITQNEENGLTLGKSQGFEVISAPKEEPEIVDYVTFSFSELDDDIQLGSEINFSVLASTTKSDEKMGYKLSLELVPGAPCENLTLQYKEDGVWKKAMANAKGEFIFPFTLPTEFKAIPPYPGSYRFVIKENEEYGLFLGSSQRFNVISMPAKPIIPGDVSFSFLGLDHVKADVETHFTVQGKTSHIKEKVRYELTLYNGSRQPIANYELRYKDNGVWEKRITNVLGTVRCGSNGGFVPQEVITSDFKMTLGTGSYIIDIALVNAKGQMIGQIASQSFTVGGIDQSYTERLTRLEEDLRTLESQLGAIQSKMDAIEKEIKMLRDEL